MPLLCAWARGWVGLGTLPEALVPCSYLVMPFMQTDLQKIMGVEFSEDKVQYLVYQMLKGLKVGHGLENGRVGWHPGIEA